MAPEPNTLTDPERWLVEHTLNGSLLDFAAGDPYEPVTTSSWGDNRTIRAEVIRDILLGRLATQPDPRGLQLCGAKIAGRLDLTYVASNIPLKLIYCQLSEGIDAHDAQLPTLMLVGCWLTHSSEPALDASRLRTGQIALNRSSFVSGCTDAAVRLVRARISESLGLGGATIRNTHGPAIRADGLQVERNISLDRKFVAEGTGADGAVRFVGASIDGDFNCSGAMLRNLSGAALVADKLRVSQSFALVQNSTAIGSGASGAVRLSGASIGAQLTMKNTILQNASGPALHADGINVQQDVFLRDES
jgi:hypothetical protein